MPCDPLARLLDGSQEAPTTQLTLSAHPLSKQLIVLKDVRSI